MRTNRRRRHLRTVTAKGTYKLAIIVPELLKLVEEGLRVLTKTAHIAEMLAEGIEFSSLIEEILPINLLEPAEEFLRVITVIVEGEIRAKAHEIIL